jgi:hypothetical protein
MVTARVAGGASPVTVFVVVGGVVCMHPAIIHPAIMMHARYRMYRAGGIPVAGGGVILW